MGRPVRKPARRDVRANKLAKDLNVCNFNKKKILLEFYLDSSGQAKLNVALIISIFYDLNVVLLFVNVL